MRHLFRIARLAAATALVCAARPAAADVVELRNGTTLEGEVVAETETSVTLRFQGGKVTFERKLVATIRKEPWVETPKPDAGKSDPPRPEAPRADGPRFVPAVPEETGDPPTKPGVAGSAKAPAPAPAPTRAPSSAPGPSPSAAPTSVPAPAPAGIVPAKDDWTLLWSAERRTGWCRAQASVDDAGKSIFEVETTLLGRDGKPAGTVRYVEEAGPGLAPLGFLLATDAAGRQSTRTGRVRDGRLVVETWENGERALRDLELPVGLRFPLAARALVLREAASPGASWKGTTFDPKSGEFAQARVSILRRERFLFEGTDLDTVVIARTIGAATTEERVAADGRVLAADLGAEGGSAVGSNAARVEALRSASSEEEASESEKQGRMALACPEDGFRIRKPGVSWVLVPPETRESRERAAVKDFSGTVGVAILSDPAPVGPEPAPPDLGKALEERLGKESTAYRRVESGAATLGGCPGWQVLADTEHHGDPVRVLVFVLARGGRVFTVTAMAPRTSFAEARPYLQRILDGIEWL